MGLRSKLVDKLLGRRATDPRAQFDAWASEQGFLRRDALPPSQEGRLAALEANQEKLEKKLSMAMGAVQAATAQLQSTRAELAKAAQQGASALATAESVADGLQGLEERLEALAQRLETSPAAAAPTSATKPAPKPRAKR